MSRDVNYREKVEENAWTTASEFVEQMIEQAQNDKVSDDLYNDYPNGDAYHHENHVDAAYSLQEAAEILHQLRDAEETDTGLWEGLQPEEAISAKAAYTYGNAVMYAWQQIVKDINDHLEDVEYDNDVDRETYAKVYITLLVDFNDFYPQDEDETAFQRAILAGVDNGDFDPALIYADWLEEKSTRSYLMKEIREIIHERDTKLKEEEENEIDV